MSPVYFTVLNKRIEQALSLTRNARGLNPEDARESGEEAAEILHAVVADLIHSRHSPC